MPNEHAAKTGHHWLAIPKVKPASSQDLGPWSHNIPAMPGKQNQTNDHMKSVWDYKRKHINSQMAVLSRTWSTTGKASTSVLVSSFIFHVGETQPLLRGSICRAVTNTLHNLIHHRFGKGTNKAQISHCTWAYSVLSYR